MGNWHKIFNFTPTIHTPYNVIFPEDWAADNKLGYRLHSYDLGVTYAGYDQDVIMIVEIGDIGDDSKHQFKTAFAPNKGQQRNDGIAKRFIEEDSPNCRFYRINKEDSLINEYLEKLFFVHGR